MKDDKLFLLHIEECIKRIEEYTLQGRKEFLASTLLQDGVLRNLQTMAESTQRLSAELKSRNPQTDWRKIAGFRNVIVHDYLGLNIEEVWDVVQREIPELKSQIDAMTKNM